MNEIVVTNRRVVESLTVEDAQKIGRFAVISISDPSSSYPKIVYHYNNQGVLYIQFYDIERDYNEKIVAMPKEDAIKIAKFVKEYRDCIDVLIVHCEAGISRSAAVAQAICEFYKSKYSFDKAQYLPNKHVYKLVLRALRGEI